MRKICFGLLFSVLASASAFDLVQSPRVDLTLRYGGALVANMTTFALPDIYGEWENVCGLAAFEGVCPSQWNFVGNAGVSLRVFPKEDFGLCLGADYTRYAGFKNQLVGIVGFAF